MKLPLNRLRKSPGIVRGSSLDMPLTSALAVVATGCEAYHGFRFSLERQCNLDRCGNEPWPGRDTREQ